MERQAHYAVVGFITLIMMAVLGVSTYWFIQSGFNNTYATYNVLFSFQVDGLNKGAEVHFNGIKVGEVTALKLSGANGKNVIATVKIDAATPVRTDSFATLEPQGVTGLAYINISPGTGPLIKFDSTKPPPVIRSTESKLSKLLSGSGSVIEDAYETLGRINILLSDKNLTAFSNTMSNLEAVSADIKRREQMLNDAHEAIVSAGQAADSVNQLAQSTNRVISQDVPAAMKKVGDAADRVDSAATAVEDLSKDMQAPMKRLNDTTIPQMEQSLKNLDDASRSLKAVADEARQSPQGFASKPPAKDRKVKQ